MKFLVVNEIKPGQENILQNWGKELEERRTEVVESIEKENVDREFAYVVNIDGKKYFIGFMESKGDFRPADMSMPVNQKHRNIFDTVLSPGKKFIGNLLYDFAR